MAKSLNAQEATFAQAMAAGKGPSASYREAYQSKMGPRGVAANAKRLLKRPHVRERIKELRRKESGESGESPGPEEPTNVFGLTPKRERFCWIYIEKSSASEAYRLSHDVAPDTKPETIHRNAHALLQDTKVTARIEEIRAELRERSAITLDHLVEALRPLAFGDIRKVCDWGPAIPLKNSETGEVVVVQDVIVKARADLDDAAAAMISKIIRGKDSSLRVELHDKLAAIEKLGKLLGLIKEQHEHAGKGGGPIQYQKLEPKAPPKDALEAYAAKYLGAIEKYAPAVAAEMVGDRDDE